MPSNVCEVKKNMNLVKKGSKQREKIHVGRRKNIYKCMKKGPEGFETRNSKLKGNWMCGNF